jgi:hypothetical protein
MKELLTTREAAEFLRVHPVSLRRHRSEGSRSNRMEVVPYIRMGRAIRYRLRDLEAYLDLHRVEGESIR